MTAQTYALINNGVVQQVLTTDQDISTLFAPGLQWVPVSSATVASPGYLYDGSNFTAPAPLAAAATTPTLATLQAQLAALQAALSAVTSASAEA